MVKTSPYIHASIRETLAKDGAGEVGLSQRLLLWTSLETWQPEGARDLLLPRRERQGESEKRVYLEREKGRSVSKAVL